MTKGERRERKRRNARYEHIAWLRMGMQTTWKQNWFPTRGEATDED